MAFNKKTWKDRVSEQPQRRLLTPTDGGEAMTVDVTRQEGIVIQEGDAFSAANMNDLETRIKNTFDNDESTLAAVNTKANTNASNISTLQTNLTSVSNRVTTNANNIAANKTTETNHYNALATRAANLEDELTANSKRIYMDYKNGKYGYNTSANRGADTFVPFKQDIEFYIIDPTESCYSLTIENASQYTKIIVVGSEGAPWYEKTGPLIITANGGVVDEVHPQYQTANKNGISAIITPTSDTVTVNLSTYNPEEPLTYPHLMAYCILQ